MGQHEKQDFIQTAIQGAGAIPGSRDFGGPAGRVGTPTSPLTPAEQLLFVLCLDSHAKCPLKKGLW